MSPIRSTLESRKCGRKETRGGVLTSPRAKTRRPSPRCFGTVAGGPSASGGSVRHGFRRDQAPDRRRCRHLRLQRDLVPVFDVIEFILEDRWLRRWRGVAVFRRVPIDVDADLLHPPLGRRVIRRIPGLTRFSRAALPRCGDVRAECSGSALPPPVAPAPPANPLRPQNPTNPAPSCPGPRSPESGGGVVAGRIPRKMRVARWSWQALGFFLRAEPRFGQCE